MQPKEEKSILVVEDDVMCRVVTRNILRRAGFNVICASDSHEAIDLVEKGGAFDIAIVDVIMPAGMPHGLMFAQMARQRQPELRVIFMSAAVNPAGYVMYGKDEAFLCKPFAPRNLLDAVTHVTK